MTYIPSPLHSPQETSPEPMSDAFEEQAGTTLTEPGTEPNAKPDLPSAPQTRLSVKKTRLSANWLPTGAVMRLNLFAELGFFFVLWAAYGFVMQYVSAPVQRLVSLLFSPWAIALILLLACLLICRFLASLVLRCKDLQRMALATMESNDTYDHADTEEAVLDLLCGAKEALNKRQRWITTVFCAITSYLIVSLFY